MTHEMPKHLPELPEGYVYAGRLGGHRGQSGLPGVVFEEGRDDRWLPGNWYGGYALDDGSRKWHYAAPIDSDLGRKILAERGKPDWRDAPDDATHLAQNADGGWVWFIDCEHDPAPEHRGWYYGHCGLRSRCSHHAPKGQPNPNWRETLERRPESEIADIQRGMNEALHKIEQEGHGTKQGDTDAKSDAVRRAIDCDILIPPKTIPGDGTSGNPLRLEEAPDLIIPADIENDLSTDELKAVVHQARFNGYRIEWSDSNGIRGWKS